MITKPDGFLGGALAKLITASKNIKLDGTLGFTNHIINPGIVVKMAGKIFKTAGVLSVVALGIGITNNFINYEHSVKRTVTDLG